MNKHILAKGFTLAAAALTLVALPIISGAASSSGKTSVWVKRVEGFETAKIETLNTNLPAKLAMMSGADSQLTAWQRDAAQTKTIAKLDVNLLLASKTQDKRRQCLSEAVYYEARSETYAGQKAVAEVVLNRVSSKHYPDTVCGVVYEGSERRTGCQFSFTCDGSMDVSPSSKPWLRAQKIADHVLLGAHRSTTVKATHYHTTDVNPDWASYVKPTRTIGSHKFYKFKNRRELAMAQSVAP